ncbi:hypothetical protein AB0K24_30930 [Streptomyces mirabilis]|uniref:hypothetical protein n=1 Tax=Streptomyces TaxID=1883 RepID=UPI0020C675CA|nr:hypothetical protein [Streptomyces sp. GbtcB7]
MRWTGPSAAGWRTAVPSTPRPPHCAAWQPTASACAGRPRRKAGKAGALRPLRDPDAPELDKDKTGGD